MTTTIVLWTPTTLTVEQATLINNKAEEMHQAGKTDGQKVVVTTEDNKVQVTRTWTTLADAQEWEVFVENYLPDSVTIQS